MAMSSPGFISVKFSKTQSIKAWVSVGGILQERSRGRDAEMNSAAVFNVVKAMMLFTRSLCSSFKRS